MRIHFIHQRNTGHHQILVTISLRIIDKFDALLMNGIKQFFVASKVFQKMVEVIEDVGKDVVALFRTACGIVPGNLVKFVKTLFDVLQHGFL
jgi:hypothetical protein